MKFEVLQEQLIEGLSLVVKAVALRPQLPVLANILIEAKNQELILSATDLEIGIKTRVVAKIESEGIVSVPARMMLDFINNLKPGKIEVELDKESLKIKAGNYIGKIQIISGEEFPQLPEISKKVVAKVRGEVFRKSVGSVLHSVARDELRPVLTGVLLEYDKSYSKLRMVATDGFRLAIRSIEMAGGGWEVPVLVPGRAIAELAKLVNDEEIEIVIYENTNQVVFQVGNSLVVSQLLAGNYPEYQKIIPKEYSGVIEMDREELLSALKTMFIFARDNSNVVRWKLSVSGVELSAQTPEKGEAKVEVVGGLRGDGVTISFNAKFVLDFLQTSKAESVTLSVTDSLSPGGFKEVGEDEYLYIVMPINV